MHANVMHVEGSGTAFSRIELDSIVNANPFAGWSNATKVLSTATSAAVTSGGVNNPATGTGINGALAKPVPWVPSITFNAAR